MKKLLTFLFAFIVMSAFTFGNGHMYVWTGAVDFDWQNAANWSAPQPLPYGEPGGLPAGAYPGSVPANDGDYVVFNNSTFNFVTNVPPITLGRFEVTYNPNMPTIISTGVALSGSFDGSTIIMRTPSSYINQELTLWILKIDETCLLDLNQLIFANRVKLVMQHGTNLWQKNLSTFDPAQYTDCDNQKGLLLEAISGDHAELIQQENTGQIIRGWVQYVFDDQKYHYFCPPVTSVWPAAPDPQFSKFFCRKHNTLCVFDGDYARKYVNGSTWDAWLGICGPIVPNPVINFETGRGYEYYGKPGNNPSGVYEIYGDFNSQTTGGINLPVNALGWNFIGNPFPSAIKFDEPSGAPTAGVGWTWYSNYTDPIAYWWDNGLGIYRFYDWFTGLGNGSDPLMRRIVPRSQGFFVHVSQFAPGVAAPLTSDITLGNLARVFRNNQQIAKEGIANNMNINLLDASNNIIDDAVINFREDANGTDFNKLLDAYKLYNEFVDVSQLYFKTTDNVDAAMKTLKLESGNIMYPVYLKVLNTGSYSLDVKDLSTFSGNTGIMLKDNKTNTTVDLRVNPVYTFTATAGDDDARFSLYFANVLYGVNNMNDNSFKIYSHDNSIFIQNNDITSVNGIATVYDMVGKQLIQENLSGNAITRINTNLNTGFYVVSVKTDKGVTTQKVYIN